MKRLLAQTGIAYFTVLAAAFYLPMWATVALLAVALFSIAVSLSVKRLRATVYIPAVAVAIAAACVYNMGFTALVYRPTVDRYSMQQAAVNATLVNEPYQVYGKYYYQVRTNSIDHQSAAINLLLATADAIEAEPYDHIHFTADLQPTEGRYYVAKGYFLTADGYNMDFSVTENTQRALGYQVIVFRRALRQAVDAYLPPDCAALCKALLVGDKYALDLDARDSFRYSGASHFVVVSGMHFSVLCLLLIRLLRPLRKRWLSFGLCCGFILLYTAVTGFQLSVIRAGCMMFFTILGITVRRQQYPLIHLGVSGLLITAIFGPYCAGDIGLILSYYATLAVLLWADPIAHKLCFKDQYGSMLRLRPGASLARLSRRLCYRVTPGLFQRLDPIGYSEIKNEDSTAKTPFEPMVLIKKLLNCVLFIVSVSIAANIFVFPISLLVFRAFSLVTLLSAVLLYAEIYLILINTLAVCIFYYLGPLRMIALLLSWPLYYLCKLVLWIVSELGSLPVSYITVRAQFVYIWLAFTVLLGVCVILYRNRYRCLPYAILGSAAILLAGFVTDSALSLTASRLEVYQSGSGICAGLYHYGEYDILSMDVKGASLYRVADSISSRYSGATVAFCDTYDDIAAYDALSERKFAISSYLLYDNEGYELDSDQLISFRGNDTFVLSQDVSVRTVPDGSHVLLFVTAGEREILIIPKGYAVDAIPADMRHADVIVLSEAGDGYSALSCDEMVICNDVLYAPITAKLLQECYQNVYITCDGDITVDLR